MLAPQATAPTRVAHRPAQAVVDLDPLVLAALATELRVWRELRADNLMMTERLTHRGTV
jgi:hypothetical protein